jgi:hypothetical protein
MKTKLVPNDIVKYNNEVWVVIAVSIMDGVSVMLAAISEDVYKIVKYMSINTSTEIYSLGKLGVDMGRGDFDHIVNSDHGTIAVYY